MRHATADGAASYLLPFAKALSAAGVDGGVSVRASTKLRRGRLEANRYYIQFTPAAVARVKPRFLRIASELQVPPAGLALLAEALPDAEDVSVGVAEEGSGLSVRAYVAWRDGAIARMIGVGWIPGRPELSVKDYEGGVWNSEELRCAGAAAVLEPVLAILAEADGLTDTFRVTDRGSPRVSFDFRIAAYRRVRDLRDELARIAKLLGIDRVDFRQWLESAAEDPVVRIGVGCDDAGSPFVTVYHGAFAQPRPRGLEPLLLPGIGELTLNPWFDDSLEKALPIGRIGAIDDGAPAAGRPPGPAGRRGTGRLAAGATGDGEPVRWVLSHAGRRHVIRPLPPFHEAMHEALAALLLRGDDAMVAVPGWIDGASKIDGELVPVIVSPTLFELPPGPVAGELAQRFHNDGRSSCVRAVNAALSDAEFVAPVSRDGLAVADLAAEKDPFCRFGGDCWIVQLVLFHPRERLTRARTVRRVTVDVSNVIPVMRDRPRSFETYGNVWPGAIRTRPTRKEVIL